MINYIVRPGDTMWNIALMHGITLNELISVNHQIKNPNIIYPGQEINIPMTQTDMYTVQKGDTLWNISQNYGTSLNELKGANPQIKNPNLIYPNQVINLPGTPSMPGTPNVPSTPGTTNEFTSLEDQVIQLVNVERSKIGVPSLAKNNQLTDVARTKSEDLITNNYFSHNSPVYGSPFNMLDTFGISYNAAAENIASGQRTSEEVMNTWMNSTGHRANILSSNYNQIGVGVARDQNGNMYWTQLFIRN